MFRLKIVASTKLSGTAVAINARIVKRVLTKNLALKGKLIVSNIFTEPLQKDVWYKKLDRLYMIKLLRTTAVPVVLCGNVPRAPAERSLSLIHI